MSAPEISVSKGLTCEPLDTIGDVMEFLDNPPAWRSLCKQLTPHSSQAIRNKDLIEKFGEKSNENFCHFDLTNKFDTKRHEKNKLPKTLVCHDLANGYHEDSFIDGSTSYDAYNFYNWAGIDIFCYFSHHFITIPPLAWINVGHAHGVKVIGTIITEWKEGESKWEAILESEAKWQEFACAMAAIAKCMRFDGWLLNVENKISKPLELVQFVGYLQRVLHEEVPGSLLIWYDSVTVDGHLAWQNGLNHKNQAFFDVSDGFFTNYSWDEKTVASSALAATYRRHDLFVGIDVWGRNFYGGGKFNTVEAVKLAHKYNCSLAIFAPAWTHEAIPSKGRPRSSRLVLADSLTKLDNFLLRERALWGSLWTYLNTNLPCTLPFQTSFCRGQGIDRWLHGENLGLGTWYNLRHMEYQPNSAHGSHGYRLVKEDALQYRHDLAAPREDDDAVGEQTSLEQTDTNLPISHNDIEEGGQEVSANRVKKDVPSSNPPDTIEPKRINRPPKINESVLVVVPKEKECLEFFMGDAYTGGSCIKINPSDDINKEHRNIRLMHCDFSAEEGIIVCVVTKKLAENNDQYLNIILKVKDCDEQYEEIVLCGNETQSCDAEGLRPVTGSEFKALQKYILSEFPHFYVPAENSFGWETRYYLVGKSGLCVMTVGCRTGLPRGGILLGHFGLCQMNTT